MKFNCDICGRYRSLRFLSEYSTVKGGGSALQAVKLLPADELICQDCMDGYDEYLDEQDSVSGAVPWLDYYREMADVDRLDRRTYDWLRQNY